LLLVSFEEALLISGYGVAYLPSNVLLGNLLLWGSPAIILIKQINNCEFLHFKYEYHAAIEIPRCVFEQEKLMAERC